MVVAPSVDQKAGLRSPLECVSSAGEKINKRQSMNLQLAPSVDKAARITGFFTA